MQFSSQELDPHCRQVLREHHEWIHSWLEEPHAKPCSFCDAMQQVPYGSIPEEGTFAQKLHAAKAAHLQGAQYCFEHGRMRPTCRPVQLDVSGLPCQDNSRANTKRKLQESDNNSIYIVWAKKHKQMGTALLILENVPVTCALYF